MYTCIRVDTESRDVVPLSVSGKHLYPFNPQTMFTLYSPPTMELHGATDKEGKEHATITNKTLCEAMQKPWYRYNKLHQPISNGASCL